MTGRDLAAASDRDIHIDHAGRSTLREAEVTMSGERADRRVTTTSLSPVSPGGTTATCRILSTAALVGIALTLVVFGALHVLPPTSDISPVSRTISEYALTSSAWAFDLAVIALAASSVAVFAGFVLRRRVKVVSAATVFGILWVVGLLTLVSFPKHNWAVAGPSSSGQIHRMASLVAFVALPMAVMAIARRRHGQELPTAARWAFGLGVASLLWFVPILIAVASTPRGWWQVIPLGLIERGMALTEVLALLALALLLGSAGSPAPSPAR